MPHTCPRDGCPATVPDDQLACYQHWYLIPSPLRNAVYRAWRGGEGEGSLEHLAAVTRAVEAMNRDR